MNTEELKQKALAATDGPWDRIYAGTARQYRIEAEGCILAEYIDDADSAYIAAANPDTILALIAERDELIAKLDRAQAEIRALESKLLEREVRP